MKKRIFIILTILVLLVIAPITACFIPPIQEALIKKIIAQQSDVSIDFKSFYIGPFSTRIEDLSLESQGLKVHIPNAQIAHPISKMFSQRGIVVEQGEIKNITIDLRNFTLPQPTDSLTDEPSSDTTPFPGLDPLSQLPLPLFADNLNIAGKLLLPHPNDPDNAFSIAFNGQGNTFAPGSVGKFTSTSHLDFIVKENVFPAFRTEGELHIEQNKDAKITTLKFIGSLFPIGEHSRKDQGLQSELAVELSPNAESYFLHLTTLGEKDARTLFKKESQFTPTTYTLHSTWEANLEDEQLAPFLYDFPLPDFQCTGMGETIVELSDTSLHHTGAFSLSGQDWEKLHPGLSGLGYFSLQSNNEFYLDLEKLQVVDASLSIVDSINQSLISFEMEQGFSFHLNNKRIGLAQLDQPFLKLSLNDFPLHWIQALSPEITQTTGFLNGTWVLAPDGPTTLNIKTLNPLQSDAIQLGFQGLPPLPSIQFSLTPEASYSPEGLSMDIQDSLLKLSTGPQLNFAGRFNLPPDTAGVAQLSGNLAVRFPQLYELIGNVDKFQADGQFEIDIFNLTAGIQAIDFALTTHDATKLINGALTTHTPLRIDLKTNQIDWPNFNPDALTFKVDSFPIAWLNPFLPNFTLTSGEILGELKVSKDDQGNPYLENITPFTLKNVTLDWKTWRIINQTDLSLRPQLKFTDEQFEFQLEEIAMRSVAGDWMDGAFFIGIPYYQKERIDFKGNLAMGFPALTSWLIDLESFSSQLAGSVLVQEKALELSNLEFALQNSQGKTFVKGSSLQSYKVMSTAPYAIIPASEDSQIFRSTFIPLPIQEVFPKPLGLDLVGTFPEGEFAIHAQDGGITFLTDKAFAFDNVSVYWQDILLFDRIGFELENNISWHEEQLKVDKLTTRLSTDDKNIFEINTTGTLDLSQDNSQAHLATTWNIHLPPLLGQPISLGFPQFQSGLISGDLKLIKSNNFTLETSFNFNDLQLIGESKRLPQFLAKASLSFDDNNTIQVDCPLTFTTSTDSSDITLTAKITPEQTVYNLNAAITSEQIVVDDLQNIVQAFLPIKEEAPESTPQETPLEQQKTVAKKLLNERDPHPFWGESIQGAVTVDLAKLKVDRYIATDLKTVLNINESTLSVEDTNAHFLGSVFSNTAHIHFDKDAPTPYTLDTGFTLNNLEMGTVFRTVNPEEKPTLEGNFTIQGNAQGQGLNPFDLLYNTLGKVAVRSDGGSFRLLKSGANSLSFLSGALGIITLSTEFRAIGRLIKQLEDFPFEQMELTLARSKKDQFTIEQLYLLAPEIQANATGNITLIEDTPIAQSPINLSMQLATQGDMKILFDGMKLSAAPQAGYTPLKEPFQVDGILSAPDASQLYALLEEATQNAKGSFGWALRLSKKKLDIALEQTSISDPEHEPPKTVKPKRRSR